MISKEYYLEFEEAKKGKIVIVASHIKEDIINLANVTYKFDGGNVTKI